MGRFDEVIAAANDSSAPCSLGGYPSVTAPGVGATGAVAAVDSSSAASGVPAAEAPGPVQLELRPGQVASAVLGGPDRTPDGAPGCRTFHGYDGGPARLVRDDRGARRARRLWRALRRAVRPRVRRDRAERGGGGHGTGLPGSGVPGTRIGAGRPDRRLERIHPGRLDDVVRLRLSRALSPGAEPRPVPDLLRAPAVPADHRPGRATRRPRALRRVRGDRRHADDDRWIGRAATTSTTDRPS